MGYEVKYFYHALKNGDYDRTVKEEGRIAVGNPYDEVSLEVLAGKVMSLMARRNIFVVGVEITEIVKKPISFRELEDGIVIKNRKFKFDDTPVVIGTGVEEVPLPPAPVQPTQPVAGKTQAIVKQASSPASVAGAVLRYEFFYPEDKMWVDMAKARYPKMAFTQGKRYPILDEKPAGAVPQMGLIYTTIDDHGQRLQVPEKLFILTMPQLDETGVVQKQNGLMDRGLNWGGVVNESVPDLRGKK